MPMPRTPRPLSQRALKAAGVLVVVAILGFLVLPAVVVAIAAVNDRAILSFPPQGLSWRWFVKALTYPDFQGAYFGSHSTMSQWERAGI